MAEISLKLKSPQKEELVKISADADVKTLREKAAETYKTNVELVCLIFAGKILKDGELLTQHKLKDGLTVHIVIKTEPQPARNEPSSNAPPTAPNLGFGSLSNIASGILNNPSGNGISFSAMQQSMQQQVMNNPDLLRTMAESPLVQSLMSNPDVMRSIMQANPQMRDLMERNPELNHILTNPEILRQSMEIAANPAMMQEMMRSYDRAVLNMESTPGGGNRLQRIFEDIQEPMMNAMSSIGGEGLNDAPSTNNPFADLAGGGARQAAPTNEPMPNPWAASVTQTNTSAGTPNQQPTTAPNTNPVGGPFSFNSDMMSNAFQAPYVQSLLENMSSNPETLETVMASNPMFSASDENTREQMRRMIPQLARQMNQPGFRNMLTNPRALQAMTQIQEGMRILQQEAPEVLSTMSLPTFTNAHAPTTAQSPDNTTGPTPPSTESNNTPTVDGSRNQAEFATLLASMLNMMGPSRVGDAISPSTPAQNQQVDYSSQIETLKSMGFTGEAEIRQALIETNGNVNSAIDKLLSGRN